MTKICGKCKTEKHLNDFNKHHSGILGRQHKCRKCENEDKRISDNLKRQKRIEVNKNKRIDLIDEIWLPVVGYEKDYEVSNLGRVYSIGYGVIMVLSKRQDKGLSVKLTDEYNKIKNWHVHRLVALAFIENPLGKPEVDHEDNNRANNRVSNLQWATRAEQIKWAYERGRDRKYGENGSAAKLTNQQVRELREQYKNGTGFTKLRDMYNISETSLCAIVKNRTYKTA